MKRKLFAILLSLTMVLPMLSTSAGAVNLPNGWWPKWSAYTAAVESGDTAAMLKTGDEVIKLYTSVPMNEDIAGGLYMVYYTRLEQLIYEKQGQYEKAVENTLALRALGEYYNSIGKNYDDIIVRCNAHLKVLGPVCGVYAVSNTQRETYGSSIAAPSGTYYGSVSSGTFAREKEAGIVSFYVELEQNTANEFNYLISPFDKTGDHVIQINLNFYNEGTTARALPSGIYDSKLRTTMQYLDSLNSPVLVRIGGEMNVWGDTATPQEFIDAYIHVADFAREYAPEVELVWSPNCTGAWGSRAEDYYPGDIWVDWVGVSLYYNYNSVNSTELHWQEYAGTGDFASPIHSAYEAAQVAKAHNKPLIATEGGARMGGTLGESFVAEKAAEEFGVLNMLYPQFKALVYFDTAVGSEDFVLRGQALRSAKETIANNPTLLGAGERSAGTYIPLEQFHESVSDTVILGATGYTYHAVSLKNVTYTLDGAPLKSKGDVANTVELNVSSLGKGSHKLEATFTDGTAWKETKTYTLTYDGRTLSCSLGWKPVAVPAEPAVDPANVPSSWAKDSVNEAIGASLVPEDLQGNYRADTTRAQFCALATALYESVLGEITERAAFTDTADVNVEKMAAIGVVNGIGGGKFGPDQRLRREQAAAMLARLAAAMEKPLAESTPTFADNDQISGYALGNVGQMQQSGIMGGVGENRFNPQGSYSREQSILTMVRLYNIVK